MENKQTAVEWLINQIKEDQTIKAKTMDEWNTVFQQSKAMEKEQKQRFNKFLNDEMELGISDKKNNRNNTVVLQQLFINL